MHEYFFLLSVFGLVLLFAIVSQIIIEKREKARTEKLYPVAQALGFQFFPKPAPTYEQLIHKFSLFKFGEMKRICNLMELQQPSLTIMLFDYLYYSGKFERKQTVVCFHVRQKRFPNFYLLPRMSPYKATHWFVQHEVSFAQDRFSLNNM